MSHSAEPEVWRDPRVVRGMERQLVRVATGGQRLGWKLGLGSDAAMQHLGTSGPVLAFLEASQDPGGMPVSAAASGRALLEPEIAVRVARRISVDATDAEIAACVEGVAAAFETLDVDRPMDELENGLAYRLYTRSIVIGAMRPLASLATGASDLRVLRGGRQAVNATIPTPAARTIALLRFSARYLAAFGEQLVPGDIVMTGSLTEPLALGHEEVWEMHMSGLPVVKTETTPHRLGRVAVYGAGRMGSQIASEYALGGHAVVCSARSPERAKVAIEQALRTAEASGGWAVETVELARARLRITVDDGCDGFTPDLVVESIEEDISAKARLLSPRARAWPHAVIATNTSSLSINEIAKAIDAPDRTIGTHYWNPPLLMPLIEVAPGPATRAEVIEDVMNALRRLGKRPVLVARDVPGFIWNRLQFALLREALWLADHDVATPEVIDQVVREGLARRWSALGPFQAPALGGIETWRTVAEQLFGELSQAQSAPTLEQWVPQLNEAEQAELSKLRDDWLTEMLARDHPKKP